MTRFNGQSFVITGGTNGIGLATAERIAAEGGRVLVTGRNGERIAAAEAKHANIHAVASDATDPEAAPRLAEEARKLFGELDGAFFSAGAGVPSPLGGITLDDFRRTFDLNVAGTLFAAQALAPLVKRGGSLLLTASGAKTKGIPGALLYASSKGAVRSMTLVLARELLPQGIRVNTLSPGPIDTDFHAAPTPELSAEIQEMMRKMVPLGRMGTLAEAAAVATFLLSSEASFVTGADYPVDGGEAQL